MGLAKLFTRVFNVRVHCQSRNQFTEHRGIFFFNHVSYLETAALFSITPGRFLAAIEVRRRPFIGWLTRAIDTIFVTREDPNSRHAARQEMIEVFRKNAQPPIMIFPEGRLGPGDQLNPFRHGAFEVAIRGEIPFMPCAIRYDRNDIALWYGGAGETLLGAVWRLATFPGPLYAEVIPLEAVYPKADDNVEKLANQAHQLISEVLNFPVVLKSE